MYRQQVPQSGFFWLVETVVTGFFRLLFRFPLLWIAAAMAYWFMSIAGLPVDRWDRFWLALALAPFVYYAGFLVGCLARRTFRPGPRPRGCFRAGLVSFLDHILGSERMSQQPAGGETEGNLRGHFPAIAAGHAYAQVVGMQDLKARLLDAGREVLQSRANQASRARNGILLFGPPGTGKTFFAEALAGELRLPIIKVDFGQLASRWVNQSTEQMKAVFDAAVQQAPCVLFIDELDAVIPRREDIGNADSETARLVSSFLPQVQRVREAGVVLVGATNFIDRLDQAAIREGRFDFHIEVPHPDEEARYAILKSRVIARGMVTHADVLKRLAPRWRGFSVARLHAVVDEAQRAVRGREATFDDFMDALRIVQGRKGQRAENGPRLEDLILSVSMRQALEGIALRMRDIEKTEAMGGSIPHGILFWGDPGTGKTFTARALAETADWAFIATSGNELLSKPERIDKILQEAADLRPCVIFIDEADDVFAVRQGGYATSVTNRLLGAMDGAGGKIPDVIFIAATNHPDNFDPAALRGGRFTEKVRFDLPDLAETRAFVERWLRGSKAAFEPDGVALSSLLRGISLANVQSILQQAVNRAIPRLTSGMKVSIEDVHVARVTVLGE